MCLLLKIYNQLLASFFRFLCVFLRAARWPVPMRKRALIESAKDRVAATAP